MFLVILVKAVVTYVGLESITRHRLDQSFNLLWHFNSGFNLISMFGMRVCFGPFDTTAFTYPPSVLQGALPVCGSAPGESGRIVKHIHSARSGSRWSDAEGREMRF